MITPKARRLLKKWVDILGNMLQSVSLSERLPGKQQRRSQSVRPLPKTLRNQTALELELEENRLKMEAVCPLGHLLALQSPLEEAQEGGQAEAVHVVDL